MVPRRCTRAHRGRQECDRPRGDFDPHLHSQERGRRRGVQVYCVEQSDGAQHQTGGHGQSERQL